MFQVQVKKKSRKSQKQMKRKSSASQVQAKWSRASQEQKSSESHRLHTVWPSKNQVSFCYCPNGHDWMSNSTQLKASIVNGGLWQKPELTNFNNIHIYLVLLTLLSMDTITVHTISRRCHGNVGGDSRRSNELCEFGTATVQASVGTQWRHFTVWRRCQRNVSVTCNQFINFTTTN